MLKWSVPLVFWWNKDIKDLTTNWCQWITFKLSLQTCVFLPKQFWEKICFRSQMLECECWAVLEHLYQQIHQHCLKREHSSMWDLQHTFLLFWTKCPTETPNMVNAICCLQWEYRVWRKKNLEFCHNLSSIFRWYVGKTW